MKNGRNFYTKINTEILWNKIHKPMTCGSNQCKRPEAKETDHLCSCEWMREADLASSVAPWTIAYPGCQEHILDIAFTGISDPT
jgi:hypothetical protein